MHFEKCQFQPLMANGAMFSQIAVFPGISSTVDILTQYRVHILSILSVILFSMLFVAFRSGRIMYAYIIREEEYSMLIFSQSLFFYHTRLLFIMRNSPNGQKAILKVFPNSINTQPLKLLTIYDIGSQKEIKCYHFVFMYIIKHDF